MSHAGCDTGLLIGANMIWVMGRATCDLCISSSSEEVCMCVYVCFFFSLLPQKVIRITLALYPSLL